MATAQVGDVAISYELADYTDPWRQSETFLLHHGYARSMEFWRAWVPLLGRDYRVVRFDVRGCGDSTKPPPGTTFQIDQLVGDAFGLLDRLGIARVHWVGESSGGIVGMCAALRDPARLASLTMMNTPFQIPRVAVQAYAVGEADQGAAIEKFGVEEWCRKTLQNRLDLSHAPPGMGAWYAKEMGRTPSHVAAALYRLFSSVDLWPRLPELRVPTLLLAGELSPNGRYEQMEQMRGRLPNAKLVVFKGYGQGISLLEPERCVAEIRAFLSGL